MNATAKKSKNQRQAGLPHSGLLTREEAARYLGLRPQTLAAWAVNGRYGLRFVRVGRLAKYRLTDLNAWLEKRTIGPSNEEATKE